MRMPARPISAGPGRTRPFTASLSSHGGPPSIRRVQTYHHRRAHRPSSERRAPRWRCRDSESVMTSSVPSVVSAANARSSTVSMSGATRTGRSARRAACCQRAASPNHGHTRRATTARNDEPRAMSHCTRVRRPATPPRRSRSRSRGPPLPACVPSCQTRAEILSERETPRAACRKVSLASSPRLYHRHARTCPLTGHGRTQTATLPSAPVAQRTAGLANCPFAGERLSEASPGPPAIRSSRCGENRRGRRLGVGAVGRAVVARGRVERGGEERRRATRPRARVRSTPGAGGGQR